MSRVTKYFQLASWLALCCVLSVYAYMATEQFSEGLQISGDEGGIYFDTYSVERGAPLKVYMQGLADLEGTIYRLGSHKIPITDIALIPSETVGRDSNFSYRAGFSADPVLDLDTSGLSSGYYVLEAQSESQQRFIAPFIVYDRSCEGIQLVAPTYTWLAYNPYLKSNYQDHRPWSLRTAEALRDKWWWIYFQVSTRLFSMDTTLKSVPVHLPYHKPSQFANGLLDQQNSRFYKNNSHLLEIEWELVEFLDLNSVHYCVLDDRSFALKYFNQNSEMFVFNGHSEYWSDAMLDSLDQLISVDSKILFTGGNNIFRKVQEYDQGIVVIEQKMDIQETTERIGTFYNSLGYGTYAPIEILEPDHWVFDGIDRDVIGQNTFKSDSRENPGGVSGHETDKQNEYSSQFIRLATGSNMGGSGGSDMSYRSLGDDGWLMTMASLSFTSGIFKDADIERIFENIFLRNDN